MKRQNIVITGASAGVARASARRFGARGARVGLLARGQAGLDATVRDVEDAGGSAIAIPTDVADYEQVAAAAERFEAESGPIDVWINDAFTTVFAPFHEVTAAEFRRVTEVTYLGFVYGTMVALARMRRRGHGTIVQVGSALGGRSVPLQSAYCGAKHAINGFTESLRAELLHEGGDVNVTLVQLPAINTPQFSWVLSRLPRHPQPMPPIYQPEVAARAVVHAADHPRRKQFWVGASTVATLTAQKIAPALLDRYLAATGFDAQQTDREADPSRRHNLWEPVDSDTDHGAHGEFDDRSHGTAVQPWLSRHARGLALTAAAVVTGAACVIGAGFARRVT